MSSKSEAPRTALQWRGWVVLWGPVLLCMALIYYFSSLNTWTVGEGPPLYHAVRKLGHVVEYGVLAVLLGRALLGTWAQAGQVVKRKLLMQVWWVGVVIATLYALTDEAHQAFVPRREFHLTDIVIDMLSATAALGIWYIWRTRKPLRAEPSLNRAAWSRSER